MDTNVLLHDPISLSSFGDNDVVIPMEVLEELDKFKALNNKLGQNARAVIRKLDRLRSRFEEGEDFFNDGAELENGGILFVDKPQINNSQTDMDMSVVDNRILNCALSYTDKQSVVLVSNDANVRVKASLYGIKTEEYKTDRVIEDNNHAFTGNQEFVITTAEWECLCTKKRLLFEGDRVNFMPNSFVHVFDMGNLKNAIICRAISNNEIIKLDKTKDHIGKVRNKNKEQRMALELLLDPEIKLVTLSGQAGTGKTLLALAAGLNGVMGNQKYDNLLVSRPIIPLGKDIGFLPGSKEEKLAPWMQPIFDNLSYLLKGKKDGTIGEKSKDGEVEVGSTKTKVKSLVDNGTIEMEAITFIRGRSIANQFIIIDEAQNLSPHEIKTFISRAGEGTKIVLTGDPKQIDTPYLDERNNGLTYVIEKFKEQKIHGHVTLVKTERSELAGLAVELL